MTVTLVVPHQIAEEIACVAQLPDETAGVMHVSVMHDSSDNVRLLARRMRWVPDSSYLRRDWNGLTIRSDGYVPFLGEAASMGASCLWVHTHPGVDARPIPSPHDLRVDEDLAPLFRVRTETPYYGAVIFSPRDGGTAFTGHFAHEGGAAMPIDRIWQVGDRFRLTRYFGHSGGELTPAYDRNVRAFGPAVQQTLSDLRIGVVGCGGTGSVVSEQIVRLGVRRLTLIDPDLLSESNLTRVYGSTAADVGRSKVEVLRGHLERIAPALQCDALQSIVTLETTARRLIGCDVVFGCTDDNAGRLVLSRLSSYLLTPVIDCGVLLSSDDDFRLSGINGRVTVLSPGAACLVCRGRMDLHRAAAELMTPQERHRRQDEGYAPALGQTEPAVVSFTTMVGATAVNELLERLVGFGPVPRPTEILLRWHDREVSTNVAPPIVGHYCSSESGKLGLGCSSPFLEQTWPM
ncbi:MAG TPA: ThiF family adenylyltransferase [Gemmatimonadaceae bacterium]